MNIQSLCKLSRIAMIGVVLMIVGVLLSCETDSGGNSDDEEGTPSSVTSPIVYGDTWNSKLLQTSAYYGRDANGAHLSTADDTANAHTGTQAYKVDFTGLTGGEYAGLYSSFEDASGVGSADLSKYNTLSFDVKASDVAASMEFVIIKSKSLGEYKMTAFNKTGVAALAGTRVVPGATTYQTIEIPFYDSSFLSDVTIAFQTQAVEGADTLGTFYFDNIQFTKKATLPAADTSSVSLNMDGVSDEVWAVVGSASPPIISGTTVLPVDMDTATPLTYNMELTVPLASVVGNDLVFGDTSIATSVGSASITGVAAGTTTVSVNIAGTNTEYTQVRVHAKDTDASKYYMYGNAVDYVGPFWYGYDSTITISFHTDAADNNNSYMKLVDTHAQPWAAGGFQLKAGTNQFIDISGYTYLVVKARAASDGAASLLMLPKFGEDGDAGTSIAIESYNATGTATATALTTSWSVHKIPVADLLNGQDATKLRILNLEFPYEDPSTTAYKVEVDEIYFE